jgi:quercetin dioxygenase-like cupin family protein
VRLKAGIYGPTVL